MPESKTGAAHWSFASEIDHISEAVKAHTQGDYTKRAEVFCEELKKLAETINILAESSQKYHESMEKYADTLEAGVARKQTVLEEEEQYVSKLEAGAAQTHEFAEEMEEYANRLESGMASRVMELAEIGEAVASMSHCIKNIVNNLKSGSYVIEQGLKRGKNELTKQGWSILGRNIDKMAELALDILAYSKKRKPEYADTDVNKLIDEIVDFSQQKAESHGVKLITKLDKEISTVNIDPKGIYRCLLNLVSNAIDACENKENSTVTVRSTLNPPLDTILIAITDTGSGMDENVKKNLFKSFFSTKGSKGTGLGLPTTFKIIKEHNGSINVQSEVNKGTTFVINLPIKPK